MDRIVLVICDVWDRHWCRTANERTSVLAQRIAALLPRVRELGHLVVHAPSDTMEFYKDTPQRLRAAQLEKTNPPPDTDLDEPAPPSTDHGGCPDRPPCDRVDAPPWPWTRQHAAIEIAPGDLITDRGDEVYSAIASLGATAVAMAGVHTDRCVLDRPFGIRQLRRWGVDCTLLRDLTEAFWPNETAAILEHIDRHLCRVRASDDVF